ncbi:type II toxin-antitoxin system HicA family toxin [Tessaracoccus sp. HF-7]|nr:type II toxin-antitoxin system HicA family toxin [Tessaracoccus caeni]
MVKPQKYRDVTRFLSSQGWRLLRSGKGSHEIWGDTESGACISVPAHGEVSAGVIRQIVREFPDAPKGWR